jgi:hypothetical protein
MRLRLAKRRNKADGIIFTRGFCVCTYACVCGTHIDSGGTALDAARYLAPEDFLRLANLPIAVPAECSSCRSPYSSDIDLHFK